MGKDLELFVTALPAWLHCPICLEAAYPPLLVCAEQHIVCHSCVGDILASERGAFCPTCRRAMAARVEVSPLVKRAFEEYSVKCRHRGCTWVGAISEESTHSNVTCMHRLVSCTQCNVHVAVSKTEEHIATECVETEIACPRGGANCGGMQKGLHRRGKSAEHDETCAEFECRVPDCKTRTTLANRTEHEAGCVRLRNEKAALAKEVGALRAQVAQLSTERPAVSDGTPALRVDAGTSGSSAKRPKTNDDALLSHLSMRAAARTSAFGFKHSYHGH